MEPKIIKTLCGMEVKIIPKQENIPDFDTKAIQIKHIDYYDSPYSSYEAEEITEEVISKILGEIPKGLNIYLYLDPTFGKPITHITSLFIMTATVLLSILRL